jgi:hypothetical protein
LTWKDEVEQVSGNAGLPKRAFVGLNRLVKKFFDRHSERSEESLLIQFKSIEGFFAQNRRSE